MSQPHARALAYVLLEHPFHEELARHLLAANGIEARVWTEMSRAESAAAREAPAAVIVDAHALASLLRDGALARASILALAGPGEEALADPRLHGLEGEVLGLPLDTVTFARRMSRLVRRRTTRPAREAPAF